MYTDRLRNLAALVLLIIFSPVAAGKFYTGNPDNYRHQLRNLRPGDQLLLTPGFYQRGLPIHHLRGEAHAPIIITGPESGKRAVFLGRRGHNTVSIIDAQHVILRNIEIDGQHLPVDGVKCEGHANWAHHITLENLLIHRHDHNQQIVGISTKCPAWNWTIRHNIIQGAGTGIYLGSSDGSAPFAPLGQMNLVPRTDKLARSSIDKYQVIFFPEWELDFSGHSDDSRFGAYAYDYSPGWLPILSIKSCRADNIRNRHLCFAH